MKEIFVFLAGLLLLRSVPLGAMDTDAVPEFDIHFTVITTNPKAQAAATADALKREVDILNAFFVSEDRKPVIRFRFKSAAFYGQIRESLCWCLQLGDTKDPYDSDRWAQIINECGDTNIRDPNAVNFYVFDSYSPEEGFRDTTCHGKRNSNRPYVLIDWERLGHNGQAPEEHEMGHAFGLEHECLEGAKPDTPSNIMTSSECGKGSGGLRNIGFNAAQVKTIRSYAEKIRKALSGE